MIIWRDENMVKILPSKYCSCFDNSISKKTAVFVNLFYKELLELYCTYIKKIPDSIDVYVISSDSKIIDECKIILQCYSNVSYLDKENRGRDVSAFLVTARDIMKKYSYVCFIHDKKAKDSRFEKDICRWRDNICVNLLGSKEYICNVLNLFEENSEIGLAVTPQPEGEYLYAWYGDSWYSNYQNTCDLAKRIGVLSSIDREVPNRALGTVFWARTKAINKLLNYDWNYSDFPEEPMPNDGTISHAVERILPFVAKDAGYETVTVMCESYAEELLERVQIDMTSIYMNSYNDKHVHSMHEFYNYNTQKSQIEEFIDKNKEVYLYGAGQYGHELLDNVRSWGYDVNGYIVTEESIRCKDGLPVVRIDELSGKDDVGIIISVSFLKQAEIESELKNRGITNYIMGYI